MNAAGKQMPVAGISSHVLLSGKQRTTGWPLSLVLRLHHHRTENETEPRPDFTGKELTERVQRRKRQSKCKTTSPPPQQSV
jgi:hypothetical protein